MDGADERDEPSRPLDAAGESLVDASRGEVTEEGDSRGDADGRERLGDHLGVPGVVRQPRGPYDVVQRPGRTDEDELRDEGRHRERRHRQETGGETRPEPTAETHTGGGVARA